MTLKKDPSAAARTVLATCLLGLWGCPGQLSPEQRKLLTGTTDTGEIAVSVVPTEASTSLGASVQFAYTVDSKGFEGTLALSLTGLVPEVELVSNLTQPSPVAVAGNATLQGTFVVRVVRARPDPIDLFLNLTSIGVAGSRVDHPPVRVRLRLGAPSSPTAPGGFQ